MIDSMTARMGTRRLMRLHLIVAVHLYRGSCAGVLAAPGGLRSATSSPLLEIV